MTSLINPPTTCIYVYRCDEYFTSFGSLCSSPLPELETGDYSSIRIDKRIAILTYLVRAVCESETIDSYVNDLYKVRVSKLKQKCEAEKEDEKKAKAERAKHQAERAKVRDEKKAKDKEEAEERAKNKARYNAEVKAWAEGGRKGKKPVLMEETEEDSQATEVPMISCLYFLSLF